MRPLYPVLVTCLLNLTACRPHATQPPPEACTLLRWEDGDTPYVRCRDGKDDPVRLLGIDTPESGFDDNSRSRANWQSSLWQLPVERVLSCGKAATLTAQEICPEGSPIEVIGTTRDRYQRRLAHILCRGKDVGAELLARGAAGHYPYPEPPERPAGCTSDHVSASK